MHGPWRMSREMAKKEPGLPLRVEFDAVRRPKKETVFF